MKNKPLLSWGYVFAFLVVAVCTGVSWLLSSHFELTNLVMIYLIGVLVVAMRGSRGPAALASALGVLCFDFFFVPPRMTFDVSDTQYLWTFGVMFAVAMLISHLVIRLRNEAEAARASERQTVLMHTFSERLSRGNGLPELLRMIADHLRLVGRGHATIFMADAQKHLVSFEAEALEHVGEKELSVAQWVYDHGEPAGLGTSTLQDSNAIYLPLIGAQGPVGVLRFRSLEAEKETTPLKAMAQQIGLALEVERLREDAKRAEVEAETERLRSSLLSSVSHDLRTPIAAVVGSAGTLLEDEALTPTQRVLVDNIQTESERLARLVHNLLEATRLESGSLTLRKEFYPLEEIVGSVLDRLASTLKERPVTLDIPESLPAIPMDAVLVEQLLINLIENVVRHTSAETEFVIGASHEGGNVVVTVSDRGPGLKPEEIQRVFEKFYHAPKSPGAGLGLTICRAIVTAHGGTITALSRDGGGAQFRFTLPLGEPRADG